MKSAHAFSNIDHNTHRVVLLSIVRSLQALFEQRMVTIYQVHTISPFFVASLLRLDRAFSFVTENRK